MVMPRSRSRSFESITRSTTASLERKVPLWRSMASTSVVLPWSTWAMMAMLRMLKILPFHHGDAEALRDAIRRLYGGRLGKSLSPYFIVCPPKHLFFDHVLDGYSDGAAGVEIIFRHRVRL